MKLCHNRSVLHVSELILDGSPAGLERISAEVSQFCRSAALASEAEFELNLALEELFMNSVRHGGCNGMPSAVRIRIQASETGEVVVEYADRGQPFDPTSVPPPDLQAPLAKRPAGGYGIHIVRELTQLDYRRDGEWNRLTMHWPRGRAQERQAEAT